MRPARLSRTIPRLGATPDIRMRVCGDGAEAGGAEAGGAEASGAPRPTRQLRLVPSIANGSIAAISSAVRGDLARVPTLFSSCATLDAPISAEVT
jgi:hypothetical protein